jgi:hypothetical protein
MPLPAFHASPAKALSLRCIIWLGPWSDRRCRDVLWCGDTEAHDNDGERARLFASTNRGLRGLRHAL